MYSVCTNKILKAEEWFIAIHTRNDATALPYNVY